MVIRDSLGLFSQYGERENWADTEKFLVILGLMRESTGLCLKEERKILLLGEENIIMGYLFDKCDAVE